MIMMMINQKSQNSVNFKARNSRFCMMVVLVSTDDDDEDDDNDDDNDDDDDDYCNDDDENDYDESQITQPSLKQGLQIVYVSRSS